MIAGQGIVYGAFLFALAQGDNGAAAFGLR